MILFKTDDRKFGTIADGFDERVSLSFRDLIAVDSLRRITQNSDSATVVQRLNECVTEGFPVPHKVLRLIDDDVLESRNNIKNKRIFAHEQPCRRSDRSIVPPLDRLACGPKQARSKCIECSRVDRRGCRRRAQCGDAITKFGHCHARETQNENS
ncbi:hypothetical protein GCM10010990_15800 [Croceicoccus mobilis]|uniref:Uncharacterized protein n=1 Tax=Croceicoccus mobilis TaxID=1703339 RepID=A0A916YYH0_9SPHN|nr:hypothetical protein GCM10010990_15800 [Croceicoccus mobilis]